MYVVPTWKSKMGEPEAALLVSCFIPLTLCITLHTSICLDIQFCKFTCSKAWPVKRHNHPCLEPTARKSRSLFALRESISDCVNYQIKILLNVFCSFVNFFLLRITSVYLKMVHRYWSQQRKSSFCWTLSNQMALATVISKAFLGFVTSQSALFCGLFSMGVLKNS